VIATLVVIH